MRRFVELLLSLDEEQVMHGQDTAHGEAIRLQLKSVYKLLDRGEQATASRLGARVGGWTPGR